MALLSGFFCLYCKKIKRWICVLQKERPAACPVVIFPLCIRIKMTLERKIAKVFGLTDENWLKHANPWSVWTRYSVLPFIMCAFWSRVWLGWWCLVPGTLSLLWMFFNPIFFEKPLSTKNWASKAVLGERVYLNRDTIEIPDIHKTPLYSILKVVSSVGMVMAIWSVVFSSISGAVFGVTLVYIGKSWFLDRMVWLYETMKSENEEYQKWEYWGCMPDRSLIHSR